MENQILHAPAASPASAPAPVSNKKWILTTIVLLITLIVYAVIFPPFKHEEQALAKVNNVSISKDQLYDAMLASSGSQTMQTMIDKELIRQEAAKANIQITEQDIQKEIDVVKKSFSSDEEFNQALAQYNMTLDGMKKDMESQLQIKKLLEPQVNITDDQIKQFYDKNLEQLKTPEQVKASHILVKTKEEATAILTDLKNGADFAAVAKEKSQDPQSKEKGGDLDFIARGTTEPEFEKAAFDTKDGALSDVVQTSRGFHVIKVAEHKAAGTPALEEKKEELRNQLLNQQVSQLSKSWLEQKRKEAAIENSLSSGV